MKTNDPVYSISDAYKIFKDVIHIDNILILDQAIWNGIFLGKKQSDSCNFI